jgi:signal transduction histidine kinase/DNA-binding response OmpR family regulator
MTPSAPPISVLIVDDRPDKLLSLEAALEGLRLNIVTADSGRNALKAILKQEFALILLDVNMPDIDGFEAAHLIRTRAQSEHTPIIFITAFGDDMHVARGYSLGAVDFILAPVVPEVLRTKVTVFIELYKKTTEVQRQARRLAQRAAQLHKLNEASLAVNAAQNLDEMLQLIAAAARDIFSAASASLVTTLDPQRPLTKKVVASGSGARTEQVPPTLADIRLLVAEAQKASVCEGAPQRPAAGTAQAAVQRAGGLVTAPLTGRGSSRMGMIQIDIGAEREFSDDDQALLFQLCRMASIAIENALFVEAREANRIKDEFLATLSHELRTPLTAMLGWVQLLGMSDGLGEETRRGLEVIERNVNVQTKLIDDLLDISRIVAGKLRLNASRVDLLSIVRSVIDDAQPAADSKRIRLISELQGGEVPLWGDPDRLRQVFWNVLNNAVKFTPAGGRIEVVRREAAHVVSIEIKDSGIGINSAFLPFVFERFRQADSTSTRSHSGLGIGLALVRHVVELHGGNVAAFSPGEGQGAVITISLPAALPTTCSGEPPAADDRAACLGDAPVRQADLSGLQVLVVDDQMDTRDIIRRSLERFGAQVMTATSALQAISIVEQQVPDLMLSDIGMPEMDGYALIRYLRQLPAERGGGIPAIAITAFALERDKVKAIEAGYQAHVTKPIDFDKLLSAVANLLPVAESPAGDRREA